jgi:hypothetical protein
VSHRITEWSLAEREHPQRVIGHAHTGLEHAGSVALGQGLYPGAWPLPLRLALRADEAVEGVLGPL